MFLSTGTTLLALDSAVSFVLVSSTSKRSYKIFTKPLCPSRLLSLPVLSKPTFETRLARVRVLPSSMTCTITQCCMCSQQMPKCMDARRLWLWLRCNGFTLGEAQKPSVTANRGQSVWMLIVLVQTGSSHDDAGRTINEDICDVHICLAPYDTSSKHTISRTQVCGRERHGRMQHPQ